MTAVVPAVEAGAAEVCRGILSTLTLFGLFVSARWREIRIWVQRDVGRPNARLLNPNFLIDMTTVNGLTSGPASALNSELLPTDRSGVGSDLPCAL